MSVAVYVVPRQLFTDYAYLNVSYSREAAVCICSAWSKRSDSSYLNSSALVMYDIEVPLTFDIPGTFDL